MRRLLAATLATTALTLAGPPSAQALTCYDQPLTLGWPITVKVGITDDGEPTYARFRQVGSGRRCTNGSDIGNSTTFRWSAPGWTVNGAWIDPLPVWGRDAAKTRVETGQPLTVNLQGKRLGEGQPDRRGGARIVIDRRWPASNLYVTLPPRTQG